MNINSAFYGGTFLFCLGIYLYLFEKLPENIILPCVFVSVFITLLGIYFKKQERKLVYSGFLIFLLALGMLLGNHASKVTKNNILNFVGNDGIVTGKIIPQSIKYNDGGYATFLLSTKSFVVDGMVYNTDGKVRVSVNRIPQNIVLNDGEIISFGSEIREIQSLSNPSSKRFLQVTDDVFACASVRYEKIAFSGFVIEDWRTILEPFINDIKNKLRKILPGEEEAIVFAMLFGGYEGLSDETIKSFSVTGLIHILSVSGAHVAIIVAVSMWLLKKMRLKERYVVITTILTICFYGMLSGMSIPVLRAIIMATAILLGKALGREANAGKVLCLVLILLLAIEPKWLFDISLLLSFFATAGIIFLHPIIFERLKRVPSFIAMTFSITLSVQLATLPLVIYYFYQISIVSFLANLFILPAIEISLMISFVSLPFLYIFAPLASILLISTSFLLSFILRVTAYLASVPFAVVTIPALPNWLYFLYYIILLIIFFCFSFRYAKRLASLLCIVLTIFCSFYLYKDKEFSVHFIDVGQGDATLLISPENKAILIDTGSNSFYSNFDTGDKVIVPYLKHYGIKEIDLMILSHGHNDHAGGAAAIAKVMPVKEIWLANEKMSLDVERLVAVSKNAEIIKVKTGMKKTVGMIDFEVIHAANMDYVAQKKNAENSSVIKATYQGTTFLFMGDADTNTEKKLVNNISKIDVLKVSHHGAKSGSDENFLNKINPFLAVISVGKDNVYGHPADETLDKLDNMDIKVMRTDINGAVSIKIKDNNLLYFGYKENPEMF